MLLWKWLTMSTLGHSKWKHTKGLLILYFKSMNKYTNVFHLEVHLAYIFTLSMKLILRCPYFSI